jgi:hypothetical protein
MGAGSGFSGAAGSTCPAITSNAAVEKRPAANLREAKPKAASAADASQSAAARIAGRDKAQEPVWSILYLNLDLHI